MWILSLLTRSAKNGAEIMDAIEAMSQGWWRPSPGSIYPLLAGLEQEGVIRKRQDGRYEVSPKARDEFESFPSGPWSRPRGIPDMLAEIDGFVSYFEDLNTSDPSKLRTYEDGIRKIVERLNALISGGKKA